MAALTAAGIIALPAAASAAASTVSVVTVTGAQGAPLPGVNITVTAAGVEGYSFSGLTNLDGRLDLSTIPGVTDQLNPYYVWLEYGDVAQYWDGQPAGQTEALAIEADGDARPITLDAAPPVVETSVSGTVVDALSGAPIENVSASVSTGPDGPGYVYGWDTTAADGTYSAVLQGQLPSTATVAFFTYSTSASQAPWGYVPNYWNNTSDWAEREILDIAAGDALTGINASLIPNGAISGIVSEYDGETVVPVPGAGVAAFAEDGSIASIINADESGSYSLPLAPGTYTVAFGEYSSGTGSLPTALADLPETGGPGAFDAEQYYDLAASAADATPVVVAGRALTPNINAIYGAEPDVDTVQPGHVEIIGQPAVGVELSADAGTWQPSGVALAYQWLRDGAVIDGATAATYTPSVDDIGYALVVRVTGTKTGLTPAIAQSQPSAVVTDLAPGALAVEVVDSWTGAPVVGAETSAVLLNGSGLTFTGVTNEVGTTFFTDVPRGEYVVSVYPGAFSGGERIVEVASEDTTIVQFEVSPTGLPQNVTIEPSAPSWRGGVSIGGNTPFTLTIQDDPGAVSATWAVSTAGEQQLLSGELAESPAGTYSAEIPPLREPGAYRLSVLLTYADGATSSYDIDLYIDPSGTVVDQFGTPLADATVAISRADTEAGPYTVIPDGSTLLSPRNRTNPDLSGADGSFGWDTVPGWYTVSATSGAASVSTIGLEVPPERLGLVLALPTGTAPVATLAPAVTGERKVGRSLHATSGTWPTAAGEIAPIEVRGYQWTRNGSPIAGATTADYRLVSADAGARIAVTLTLGRSHGVDAGLEPLTFTVTTAPVAISGVLPATGFGGDLGGIAFLGMVLLAVGAGAVSIRRRRQQA